MNWRNLAKYFVHGLAFTILFLILSVVWLFFALILVTVGFILGFIIGLIVLFIMIGFLNALITTYLWFDVKSGVWSLFVHGFVLTLSLAIVNSILVTIPNLVFPAIWTYVVTFIIGALADGFLAKNVAGFWKESGFSRPGGAEVFSEEPV